MHLKTFRADGATFVVSPYHPGISIREDVFRGQLLVSCVGEVEYPEDVPIYGTYWIGGRLALGRCGLIEEAMALAGSHVIADDFDLADDSEALSFRAELIEIHDERRRLVLAGRVEGYKVDWCKPVSSAAEASEVRGQIRELHNKICFEMRADNYSTMRYLGKKVRVRESRFVATCWRDHATRAILATET
ncbi:hypothetical protein [Shinella sp.]|uniref:hypothetical protein n=1 Tax=Shinella sp. TaxID=1870904 RepID=UPI002586C1B7|nr:hypothetical protein [Shinella sp.]MCW5706972.1 hypothetical protein [Shinella sp.]